jgi:hypothetical protein
MSHTSKSHYKFAGCSRPRRADEFLVEAGYRRLVFRAKRLQHMERCSSRCGHCEQMDACLVNKVGVGENYAWADMYYFVCRNHQHR